MLYQTLVGAWPLDLDTGDREALQAFAERVAGWQQKALREAKRHSGWAQPNEPYEAACRRLLDACLAPDHDFVADLRRFVGHIAPAGALNGLAQALLRMTTPGLPDLYQGTEFWDFSLVDPDNRRPVDQAAREAALRAAEPMPRLLDSWSDGHLKQALIARTLDTRRAHPALFADGSYQPLPLRGRHADRGIAFRRAQGDAAAVVVVPRLVQPLLGHDPQLPHVPPQRWEDTAIALDGEWQDVLAGRTCRFAGQAELSELLHECPLALLLRRP
jgi:(1->4)-alpha-D-glucan 1-alpha-D-glucosylmutase